MGSATHNEAANWVKTICNAIRANDDTRPVYSGMHSLTCEGVWTFDMLSENCDVMTTHPYPLFTPHCCKESLLSLRAALHSAAESVYYAGISGKPCLVEECGTLGDMILNKDDTAKYFEFCAKSALYEGCIGFLWWCAFDQDHLNFYPYDKKSAERGLGIATSERKPKPILEKMKEFSEFLKRPREQSVRKESAVCILSNAQDQWGVAYSAYTMAALAEMKLRFIYETAELPDSNVYLLPCIAGGNGISKYLTEKLEEKVKKGATLYISYDGGMLGDFEKLTGLLSKGYIRFSDETVLHLSGAEIPLRRNCRLQLQSIGAEILASDENGPLLTLNRFGKGKVYFLNAPLESDYAEQFQPEKTNAQAVYSLLEKGSENSLLKKLIDEYI